MRKSYTVSIEVTVNNAKLLRAHALERALDGGMTEEEFTQGECGTDFPDGNDIEYWLLWAFDAGSPPNAGFEIEDSGIEFVTDQEAPIECA